MVEQKVLQPTKETPGNGSGHRIDKRFCMKQYPYVSRDVITWNSRSNGQGIPYAKSDTKEVISACLSELSKNPNHVASNHKLGSIYMKEATENENLGTLDRLDLLEKARVHFSLAHEFAPHIEAYQRGAEEAGSHSRVLGQSLGSF